MTLKDSEEKIANRIMFNLLDADKSQLKTMSKEAFMKRFENVKKIVKQKLIIKEFPEYSICANHFHKNSIDYIVCSPDKDLKQIVGNHYDYKKCEFDYIDEYNSLLNLFGQILKNYLIFL